MATNTRRKRAKRGEGDKLREEILEVADRLLLDAGSESAVSIQAIADGVGCTPPAIYMHFSDKDALMFEVCARHFERFVEALAHASDDDHDADPLEMLRSRGRAYVQYGLDNPEPYRILFMQRAGESATGGISVATAESFNLVTEAVQECLDSGVFPEGDPFTVACALWASIHGLTSLMISNPDYPWPPLDDLLAVGKWASTGTAPDTPVTASGATRARRQHLRLTRRLDLAGGRFGTTRGSPVEEAPLDPIERLGGHGRYPALHVVGHPRQGGDGTDRPVLVHRAEDRLGDPLRRYAVLGVLRPYPVPVGAREAAPLRHLGDERCADRTGTDHAHTDAVRAPARPAGSRSTP